MAWLARSSDNAMDRRFVSRKPSIGNTENDRGIMDESFLISKNQYVICFENNKRWSIMLKKIMDISKKQPEKGTLIVGCGDNNDHAQFQMDQSDFPSVDKKGRRYVQHGNYKIYPNIDKNHLHKRKGGTTLDIDPNMHPDIVASIATENLVNHENYKKASTENSKFSKVNFECIPNDIFNDENNKHIVENLRNILLPNGKVSINTGHSNFQDLDVFCNLMRNNDFKVKYNPNKSCRIKARYRPARRNGPASA